MPLKLMLAEGDQVIIRNNEGERSDDVYMRVLTTGKRMQLELAAPRHVEFAHIKADFYKMHGNDTRGNR